ncbi:XylR family transcriptional regulator [Coraliomargarita sinensis]|uniref:XylR family transcriptional regulator n=1 Tax=Coraliomargarita sinensis TaxID=2174842 RepID=A0A317ZFR5_9BACT|nr:DNA-binding transcriptional regulator [Coraliomargarita sinensis]PXA04435.1 XylR family transcriptional regulator [Coraliomargarita sinensis]
MKKIPRKKPSPRVALLIESSRSYGRELLMGIAEYVRIHGPWSIEFEEGNPLDQLPEWFGREKWDGILARVNTPDMAKALRRKGVPVIDLSASLPESAFPQIRSDEDAVGRLAAEHLMERGFKQFAFCGYNGTDWSDARRDSFERRVAGAGLACQGFENPRAMPPPSATDYEEHGERHERDLICWLKTLPKPCGLMACNDARARQVLNCCREAGVSVPDEVAIIGVDKDEIFCELCDMPLSSVILNTQQIGFKAAELLSSMMTGECTEPGPIAVQPLGVMARQSTDVLAIDDRHIAAALRQIREHACDGLDVETLLKTTPLSRSVLERRFSQFIGSSPKAEILRVRLDRVCQLLAGSSLPLAEVAGKTGFEHPEYMSRLFKKKMGMTPGEFRKSTRAKERKALGYTTE